MIINNKNNKSNDNKDDREYQIDLDIHVDYYATPEGELPFAGDLIFFNLSDVPDEIDYLWNFGDGKTMKGVSVTHSYAHSNHYNVSVTCVDGLDPGEYTFTVTVFD